MVVALDRTGNVLAKGAGRGRVKAEEIDVEINIQDMSQLSSLE
jgi:hypothetical protein